MARGKNEDSLRQRKLLKVTEEVALEDRRSRQDLTRSIENDSLDLVRHGESVGGCEYDRSKSIETTLLELLLEGPEDWENERQRRVSSRSPQAGRKEAKNEPGRFLT